MRPTIADVLADRYASEEMLYIWSTETKITLERMLWIAVLWAQHEMGCEIKEEAIKDYEECAGVINLESIRRRELRLRHEVKARIEEFNELAGHELIHMGMTSRDLTENVEQEQILQSMEIVRKKLIAILGRLSKYAVVYINLPMVGRSHNVPAQVTTLGKRFANVAEELEHAFVQYQHCFNTYPLRGIKGPVGTQQDMLNLLGDEKKVHELERKVAEHLGFKSMLTSVGQVYPRSLDFNVLSELTKIGAVASNFATTLRLMAGHELVTEGFREGQVGSSAMPHKMNARSSERICSFYYVLRGYLTMIEGSAGNQWNEGDVSCSVVRRVALQGAFFAVDGLLETWLTVLDEFGAYPVMIIREVERYLPFLSTTKLLMAAIKSGMGREEAHALIKKHAVDAALEMRNDGLRTNPLILKLSQDKNFPLSLDAIEEAIGSPLEFVGLAQTQVKIVASRIEKLCNENPDAANYMPKPIL